MGMTVPEVAINCYVTMGHLMCTRAYLHMLTHAHSAETQTLRHIIRHIHRQTPIKTSREAYTQMHKYKGPYRHRKT